VDGAADFRGPFVQGPRGGRFVYLDIGTLAGQHDSPWSRRLKVPLSGITTTLLRRASSGGCPALEARVPGTGRDGTPSCASVKDFRGVEGRGIVLSASATIRRDLIPVRSHRAEARLQ
jgi:hypothetical protein